MDSEPDEHVNKKTLKLSTGAAVYLVGLIAVFVDRLILTGFDDFDRFDKMRMAQALVGVPTLVGVVIGVCIFAWRRRDLLRCLAGGLALMYCVSGALLLMITVMGWERAFK